MSKTTVIKLQCLYCNRLPKNHQEVLELNFFGFHLGCDHVYADVLADQKGNSNENN